MVRAKKRLPSSVSVSQAALNSASSALQKLPDKPKENWSLREAVSVLQESISLALSRGYSYEEVAKMLSAKGVEISASSLKSYLSAAKRQKANATKGKGGGRRKTSEADVSMNGAATAFNGLKAVTAAPAKPARQPKTAATPARKSAAKAKPAAKTTTKTTAKATAKSAPTAAKTKAAPKTTAKTAPPKPRGRKKSS